MPNVEVQQEATSVLVEIGQLLQQTRENKGLTLAFIEDETKIRRYYLRALEQGEAQLLPGDVYLKGFLKNYANFLGLPGEDLVRQYSKNLEQPFQSHPISTAYEQPSNFFKHRIILPAALLIMAVIAGFWLSNNVQNQKAEQGSPPVIDGEQVPFDANPSDIVPRQMETVIEIKAESADEIVYNIAADSLLLTIEVVRDRCWIAVKPDNLVQTTETVYAPNIRTISATNRIWLRAGNPGAIQIKVNDMEVGVVGISGKPRNILFELVSHSQDDATDNKNR